MSQSNLTQKCESPSEDFVAHFQNMPQTSSAVALWLVKFDASIALQLDEVVVVGTGKGMLLDKIFYCLSFFQLFAFS